jgi:hypothetical protein
MPDAVDSETRSGSLRGMDWAESPRNELQSLRQLRSGSESLCGVLEDHNKGYAKKETQETRRK